MTTAAQKLKAISRLEQSDGISYADWHDISIWEALAGPHFDTTVLSEKSIERINAIFARFFIEEGA